MSLRARLVHTAIMTAYWPAHRALLGITDLRATQAAILAGIVRANQDCQFGRAHDFGRIRSIADYQRSVPISTWQDYADAAAAIAAGTSGVLTAQPVRLLEPSSGSTAATKLIPYTDNLKAEFQRALHPWLHDLYSAYPQLRAGGSYWSVTPAITPAPSPAIEGGTDAPRIGFDDDADYLGPLAKRLLTSVFAVPSEVAHERDVETFRRRTCLALLRCRNLRLISVWNPTFFTLLLDWMSAYQDELLPRLEGPWRTEVAAGLRESDTTRLWPQLAVMSCWADAHAAVPAQELANRFPHATVQPKGLVATEGCVSVPVAAAGGAIMAARSHFFEFVAHHDDSEFQAAGTAPSRRSPDPSSAAPIPQVLLADELEVGGRYQVLLTTSGGLYRYQLGDIVAVTGYFGALPILKFVGRHDKVSDLVGEKLSEAFATQVLNDVVASEFSTLVPRHDRYVLYRVGGRAHEPSQTLAQAVDAALRANFHYDYARRLGQLRQVQVVALPEHAVQRYYDDCARRGQRIGDVKPAALTLHPPAWFSDPQSC